MDLGLAGKTAIVTGGASNIGKAIVEGFFAEGVNVVIADVDEEQGARVAAELNAKRADGAIYCNTDVGELEQTDQMAAATLEAFGGIDILVNNAGWTANALFMSKPMSDFEREISINLWGPINCIRSVAPTMIEKTYGKIVNIGSDAGRVGEYNEAVYGACKAGVENLGKALARELGRHKLNINTVCPGLTLPEKPEDAGSNSLWHEGSHQSQIFQNEEALKKVVRHYPLRRVGVPADIVPMVLLFASDQTSYATGQTVSISGGYAM
jgi:2-hydroxycyclohexanecarboxyl-CoA dehydrogenase